MAINTVISRNKFNYATDVDAFFPYVTMGSEVPFTADPIYCNFNYISPYLVIQT